MQDNKIINTINDIYLNHIQNTAPDSEAREGLLKIRGELTNYVRDIDLGALHAHEALGIALMSAIHNNVFANSNDTDINSSVETFMQDLIHSLEFVLPDSVFNNMCTFISNMKSTVPAAVFYENVLMSPPVLEENSKIEKILKGLETAPLDVKTLAEVAPGTSDASVVTEHNNGAGPASVPESVPEQKEISAVDEFLENTALAKGITIISSDDWKKSNFARTIPIIVKNFNFKHVDRPELGIASYLLIGPKNEMDTRIEIRTQNVSGSAGDKLPVLIHKLHSMQQTKQYGKTCAGIIGDINFFSKYALELTRQVAATSGRVIYAEGDNSLSNALTTIFEDTKELYSNRTKNIDAGQSVSI